ncbi:hypothetical protein [Methylobacterium sp. Leaf456]|uniref:hypothetical protein n=1 Tax=Methylobacterium sp. Leaf456 TaxID=1736382 RepID=UPI000AADAA94|nr:hypothetical protein [Methylobacterium sp. Leaf456]
MEALANLMGLAAIVSALAFLLGLLLSPFQRYRRMSLPLVVGGLMIGMPMVFVSGRLIEKAAIAAGFDSVADRHLAQEVGITDAKAFYADAPGIRARVKQKRLAENAAQERAAQDERDAADAADRVKRRKEAREASDAITELATPAPLDQQPPFNGEFGSGMGYRAYLRTASGYPFVRTRMEVPFCTHPYAAKDAGDAMRTKDRRWAESIAACRIHQAGTAVEWIRASFDGQLPVVVLRIRSPDGGRQTVYAPDSSDAGIPFWMGFYNPTEMRLRQSAEAR